VLVKRPVIPSYPYRSSYEYGQIEGVSAESPRNARHREGVAAAFGTPGLRVRPMNFHCGRPAGLVNPVPGSPSTQTLMASRPIPGHCLKPRPKLSPATGILSSMARLRSSQS
jgi:hypothetical protein